MRMHTSTKARLRVGGNIAQEDEEVVQLFLRSKGMTVARFDKQEIGKKKTPDFKVFDPPGSLAFYCEVKSISKDDWLDNQLDQAPPLTIVGGARNDPTYNKVSNKIHEAVAQFDSINQNLAIPNVLVFVNHEDMYNKINLYSVLTGNFPASNGAKYPIYRQFSEGRIMKEKNRIHLYIWLEGREAKHYQFSSFDQGKKLILHDLFKLDQENIREI